MRCVVAGIASVSDMVASGVLFIDGVEASRFEIFEDGEYSMVLPELDEGEHTLSLRLELEQGGAYPVGSSANPAATMRGVSPARRAGVPHDVSARDRRLRNSPPPPTCQ